MPAVASGPSFSALRRALRDAVSTGEIERVQGRVDGLHQDVMEALVAGDRARLAELGGQVARLSNIAVTSDTAAAQALAADLRRIGRTVEIGWAAQVVRGSRQEPHTPGQFTVRERVLALLREQPTRPRDLARALGVDRTQVSRALRELERAGKVRPATSDRTDGRAVTWDAV